MQGLHYVTPGSGTTKLQKVLAASADFNFLTFWQNFNWASFSGEPGEPIEARIAEADAFCRYAEMPSYASWLAGKPRSIFFAFLRDVLKYLQWQGLASPDRPWLLKSPNYNGLELQLLDTFPDARCVVANRSPLKTLPSMCKLVQCFRQAYGKPDVDHALIIEGNYRSMDAHLANRRAHPDLPILDVRFEDVVGALPGTLQRIYDHTGRALTTAARERMLASNAE